MPAGNLSAGIDGAMENLMSVNHNPAQITPKRLNWLRKNTPHFADTFDGVRVPIEQANAEAVRIWEATPPEMRCGEAPIGAKS